MELDWKTITQELDQVQKLHPFQIFFYGSRERGDHTPLSDYNFYLVASPQDQLRSSFIQDVTDAVGKGIPDSEIPLSLIAGDRDSLVYRMEIFEPTAVHLLELGRVVHGEKEFGDVRRKWEEIRTHKVDFRVLLQYLENRTKFYKSLSPRSTKDDVGRIEKILSLTIQTWILCIIEDLSVTEIAFLDIPNRLVKLIKILYDKKIPKDIHLLTSIYEEIHELKKSMRTLHIAASDQLSKLKDSILQIQDLSSEIEKIV